MSCMSASWTLALSLPFASAKPLAETAQQDLQTDAMKAL